MPEMVDADLRLEPIHRFPFRRIHHTRVVDQEMKGIVIGKIPSGEGSHGAQVTEIEPPHLEIGVRDFGANLVSPRPTLRLVSARERHRRPLLRKLFRGDETDAGVGASHNHTAPMEILAQDFGGTHQRFRHDGDLAAKGAGSMGP